TPIPLTGLADYEDEEISSSLIMPITAVNDNEQRQLRKSLNLGASFSWEIVEGLKIKSEVGINNYNYNRERFYGQSTFYVRNWVSASAQGLPAAELRDQKRNSFRNTNTLNYDFSKLLNNKDHNLNLLVGQEMVQTESSLLTSIIEGYPSFYTADDVFRLTSQGTPLSANNALSPDDKLLSFFGRANYGLMGKYLLSVTFRADGSSRFAEGNRWGYFPSAAIAWRISEESFMQSISTVVNDLKLRFSYGTAGNNNIPSGEINKAFSSSPTVYINNEANYLATSTRLANPNLKWETTYTRNLGLDFGLFKNRLSGTVEIYYNTTKDLLLLANLQGVGYNTQYQNMGETENQGFEATLNWVAIDKENVGLNIGFNIGMNRNKIVSLGSRSDYGEASGWASTEIKNDYWIAVGGPVGQIYGYLSDGRYEVSDFESYDESTGRWILKEGVVDNTSIVGRPRPGSMKLKDIDGDNDVDIDDNTIIGDVNPLSVGGFSLSARFYGFDISTVFSWSYGNKIYNANNIEFTQTGGSDYKNMIDIMADGKRWTNIDANGQLVNDPATLASMNANTTMWSPYTVRRVVTDWAVEDASFLRLNTLSLGYTLPSTITERVRIKNLRIYASCYNVFVLTGYSGFDPEVSTRRATPLTPGVDYSAYPKSRQFIFGLNLNF
ncbi:MAG: SusC/RagA family TonB-linked outer membrane protein, partial [Bacteroidales bacterium]|nr:SusC/RagA family TonB-linked outer membrane protein [Bacteroidales bacterium]